MGSAAGALKTAAKKAGVTVEEYEDAVECGMKRCSRCSAWRDTICFGADESRWDRLSPVCCYCRQVVSRKTRKLTAPSQKVQCQATEAIRQSIKRGRLALPGTLPCFDCGEKAAEYHHYLGYDSTHWLDVQALCRSCHQRRHW